MRAARFAILAIAVFGVVLATSAAAAPPGAPGRLRGFELRTNEVPTHTFSRTPAFAWSPVRGASCYEFELATSRSFDGSSVFWSNVAAGAGSGKFCRAVTITAPAPDDQKSDSESAGPELITTKIAPIRIPATSVNLVLPWFTGKPYALYAHVRAVTTRGATAWSKPFGFNMRWESTPVPMVSKPGLVRWAPVEGATAYDVWYPDIRKVIRTHTNVADQRELYSFHLEDSWWQLARWRVRPVRQVVGALPNGLPAVSYGPWSPTYATTNPVWAGREAAAARSSVGRGEHGHEGRRPSAHASDDVRRRHRNRRTPVPALPRICLHRSRLRERGLPRLCRRRAGVRTPDLRARSSCRRTRRSSTSRSPASSRARSPRTRRPTWPTERRSSRARRGARTISSVSTSPTSTRRPRATSGRSSRWGSTSTRTGRSRTTTRSRRRTRASRVAWPASARSRGPRSPARERRSSRACRRRAACSRRPAVARSSTRLRSSRGGPSSAPPATRSSGRARSTPGAREAPS